METGKKIFYLSPDTGKESGNISTPVATLDNNTNTGHSQAVIKSGQVRDDTSFASQKQIKDGLSNQLMRRNHISSCQTYFQKCSVIILKTKMGLRS